MATYYIDPSASANGSGTENDPYNTFVGLTWGAHTYKLKSGTTLYETVTFGAGSNGASLTYYGNLSNGLPIIDCQNTRNNGIDLNSKVGCSISYIKVINQNAAVPNAGIRITGSKHSVFNNYTQNCQSGIHVNSSIDNLIYNNYVDVGNSLTPTMAYGIRVNQGTSSANTKVFNNTLRSTAKNMQFMSALQFYGAVGCFAIGNDINVPMADALSLHTSCSGCYVVGNYIWGDGILDGLIIEASNSNFIWNNTVVHINGVQGHFGPALKMGDGFGAGAASDSNNIQNNIFVMRGENKVVILNPIGASNTINNNCIYSTATDQTSIINFNNGGGVSAISYAGFVAEGYQAAGSNSNPGLSIIGLLPKNSALQNAGIRLHSYKDVSKKMFHNPPSLGAYEVFPERAVR